MVQGLVGSKCDRTAVKTGRSMPGAALFFAGLMAASVCVPFMVVPALAQDLAPAPQAPAIDEDVEEVPMLAVLRGLDKVTARVREYELPVGQTMRMGGLEITVKACHTRPPEEPPESTAFLEIDERRSRGRERIFSGWMFASSPALNPLEHPVYDVWVMTCKALSPEQGASSL